MFFEKQKHNPNQKSRSDRNDPGELLRLDQPKVLSQKNQFIKKEKEISERQGLRNASQTEGWLLHNEP